MFQVLHLTFWGAAALQHRDAAIFAPPADRASQLLWDGFDVLDGEDTQENSKLFGPLDSSHLQPMPMLPTTSLTEPLAAVEVLGLQDTGTNLVNNLMYKNFPLVAHYDSTRKDGHTGIWKHANVGAIERFAPQEFDSMVDNGVVPIVVVRNPLSWLQSLKKAAYELWNCTESPDWLTQSCMHKFPGGYLKDTAVPKITYKHLTGIWGRWVENYRPVLSERFDKMIVLRYEDVVTNTTRAVQKLAENLNLTVPSDIDIILQPAKAHGSALGHDEALKKLQNKEYLKLYTEDELHEVCQQLRHWKDLMAEFSYDDCSTVLDFSKNETTKTKASHHKTSVSKLKLSKVKAKAKKPSRGQGDEAQEVVHNAL